jgi:hypothetical protein
MSRALDILLLVLVGFFAWKLVRADDHLAAASGEGRPLTAKVRVLGEAPLDGLGLLIIPSDESLGGGFGTVGGDGERDTTPHQLSPFYRDRTTQIIVPAAGRYLVRFGLQDQGPPPRRPRGVTIELAPEAKAPQQTIEVTAASMQEEILIDLPPAHAAGLQALRKR